MSSLRPVRGTSDALPEACRRFRHITDTAHHIAALYGYGEISTPIFEFASVFSRTLGAQTDVVTKEMYVFTDRGGNELSLRPEGTAGVARAFISNAMTPPCKLFYRGPMFRYERPQRGRLRQFHQCGVEFLGIASPLADVETIILGQRILDALGLSGRLTMRLNSLGDAESRAAYRRALVDYLEKRQDELSPESRLRLQHNPLRVLDSKDSGDRSVVADAPVLSDWLNDSSSAFFAEVCDGLAALGIDFVHDPFLVRGLDYYCHTAFEFVSDDLGTQNAVLAGGRYDGLVETLGGSRTPGVGWAAGIERLSTLIETFPVVDYPVAVVAIGDHNQSLAMKIAESLRSEGIAVEIGFSGNLKKRLARAHKIGAKAAVFIGDEEVNRGAATIRNLDDGEQTQVIFEKVPHYFQSGFPKPVG